MNREEKLKRLRPYPAAYFRDYKEADFEIQLTRARQNIVLEHLAAKKPAIVVEIGCGVDLLYTRAQKISLPVKDWIIVEPISSFVDIAKKEKSKKIRLHTIEDFFEDCVKNILETSNRPVDFIVCSGMLHEVPNPKNLLSAAKKILSPRGTLHVNVPNAQSLHRRLAKTMGLIKTLGEFSKRNKDLLQQCVFDIHSLTSLIERCGFHIEKKGGYFIKPFSNKQMKSIGSILTKDVFNGLWLLGKELPELANEIYINARLK